MRNELLCNGVSGFYLYSLPRCKVSDYESMQTRLSSFKQENMQRIEVN